MTIAVAGRAEQARRTRLPMIVVLGLCAVAWAVTGYLADDMGNGPGPMGLDVGSFLGVWVAMMAAMMFPALSNLKVPAATWQARCSATCAFAFAYLVAWALVGSVAYVASHGTGSLARHHSTGATALAVALFGVCGIYQLTSWKWRAVQACAAAPLVPVGAQNAIGSGLRYGSRCIRTSWAAMALLLALGFMQVFGMVVVTAALFVERRAQRRDVAVFLGLVALGYGVAIALRPSLAPGLWAPMTTMPMDGM